MSAYRLAPRARDGLLRIALYVEARFGVEAADRVLDDIEHAFLRLAKQPGLGHHREDLTSDSAIRFWSVGPSVIAYRASKGSIEILFVERGELDWEDLLGRRP